MMDWLMDPQAWIGLLTLTALEIVLGIDNIVFISILVGKLPPAQQQRATPHGARHGVVRGPLDSNRVARHRFFSGFRDYSGWNG